MAEAVAGVRDLPWRVDDVLDPRPARLQASGRVPGPARAATAPNQTFLGALARASHGTVSPGPQWTLAGVLGVLGVALAVYVHFRWSPFLGVALCATAGLLVSPVTWTHHMIWVLPAAVWLGAAPGGPGSGALGGGIHDGALLGLANLVGGRRGKRAPARERLAAHRRQLILPLDGSPARSVRGNSASARPTGQPARRPRASFGPLVLSRESTLRVFSQL